MKKNFYYFLVLVCTLCMTMVGFTSCQDKMDDELFDSYSSKATGKVVSVVETVVINKTDTIYIQGETRIDTVYLTKTDTVYVTVVDTIYNTVHDTVEVTVEVHELKYALGSNKEDKVIAFDDDQPTFMWDNDELVLMTDVNRNAALSNESDTLFVSKVSAVKTSVSRPGTDNNPSTRGKYNINTQERAYDITANDGYAVKLNTGDEAASAEYRDEVRDLLSRQVNKVRVLSINDEATEDTIVKNKTIYRKVNRTMEVEVESFNRPLMGIEILTLDTLKISSADATKDNGIAVVYVEEGPAPDPDPVDPVDPTPGDTIPVDPTPGDTVPTPTPTPDDGYTINGEKIESIMFSYTPDPTTKTLVEVLLVRTKNYVLPIVSKQKKSAIKVADPNAYNSVAMVNNAWKPATLDLSSGFVWSVDGTVVASATDATIDWLANKSGISSISKSDFLKSATFVNEGKTTRVYVDNKLYMTLK